MKWTTEETIDVPTTVKKTVTTECTLVVHRRREGASYEGNVHHEYVPATEDDLRRAAESLGLWLTGPLPHCTCGANAACAGMNGPTHTPECALSKIEIRNVTIGGETEARR